MYITCSVVSCKLELQASRFFQFSFFLVKIVNRCEVHAIFQYIEYQICFKAASHANPGAGKHFDQTRIF